MKNKYVAAALAWFVGWLGIHRFYLGETTRGIFYLLFFWTFIPAIIAFIDTIMFLVMDDEKFDRLYNPDKFEKYADQPTTVYREATPAPAQQDQFETEADRLYHSYQTQDALPLYKRSLDARAHNPKLHFKLACIYSMHEDTERSLHHLETAINQGYGDFQRINTHEHLSYLRAQPEYPRFKANGYQMPEAERLILEDEPRMELDSDLIGQIERLAQLKTSGILTEEEFNTHKQRLLGK